MIPRKSPLEKEEVRRTSQAREGQGRLLEAGFLGGSHLPACPPDTEPGLNRGAKTEACSPPTVWSAAVPLGRGTVRAPNQARMLRVVQPCQTTGYAGGLVWNSSHSQDSLDGKAGVTQTPTRGQQWEGSTCVFEGRQRWKNSTILLKVVRLISFIFRCFIIEYIIFIYIYIYIYFFFFLSRKQG